MSSNITIEIFSNYSYQFFFILVLDLISGPTSTETLAMQDHSGTSEDQVPVKNSPQRPVRLDIIPPPPLISKAGNANGTRRSPMVSIMFVSYLEATIDVGEKKKSVPNTIRNLREIQMYNLSFLVIVGVLRA